MNMGHRLDYWGTLEPLWTYGYGDMLTYVPSQRAGLMPPSRTQGKVLPAWASALRMRRAELGKSQEAVALDSGILNQTTVSELEGGKYEISNLTAARVAGLARGLNWSLSELETALGIDLGLSTYVPASKPSDAFTAKARGYRVPKPPRPVLPDSLIDAGRIYGDKPGFEGVKEPRWQYHMAGLPHRRRPQTPEEWLALYIDLRDRYDPPEVEE